MRACVYTLCMCACVRVWARAGFQMLVCLHPARSGLMEPLVILLILIANGEGGRGMGQRH